MVDLVGTCPKDFWFDWIAEGDAAGDPETGEEWGWYTRHSYARFGEPGDRFYVVAHGLLRGYAPIVRVVDQWPAGYVICRKGGAVAVTLPTPIKGFRGIEKRWWDRGDDIDHQRTNNAVENLEWTTRAQNYQHSHERSLSRSNGKVRSKLTPDDVAAIYAAKPKKWKSPGNGAIAADLAAKYGVNFHLIGKIWRGERRGHDGTMAAQNVPMSRACGPEDK